VLLSNGSTITRSRSGKENLYYYQAKGEEALKLEAVRTDVPDEIARLLAIDETVNLQAQADHHFLLDESSPEVARILNAVVGLDGIDQAHTRIAGKVREWQESTRQNNGALQTIEDRVQGYAGLEELEKTADNCSVLEEETDVIERQYSTLEDLRRSYQTAARAVDATSGIGGLGKAVSRLEQALMAYNEVLAKDTALNAIGTALGAATSKHAAFSEIDTEGLLARLDAGFVGAGCMAKTLERGTQLVNIGKSMTFLATAITNSEFNLTAAQQEFGKLACPTCGTKKGAVRE
jgi:DNA repair exonuclease SbcCD ATPase subunit